jgi:hypothetical protein
VLKQAIYEDKSKAMEDYNCFQGKVVITPELKIMNNYNILSAEYVNGRVQI